METFIRSFEATIDEVDAGKRMIIAKINTDAIDRYRTVIMPSGAKLDAYRRNPVVLWEHGQDPNRGTMPIGKNDGIFPVSRGMVARTIFKNDPYSMELFRCYQEEWIKGWSVRMVNPKYGAPTRDEIRSRPELSDCDLMFREWELGEYSGTVLPGNSDTLTMLASRGIWIPEHLRTATDQNTGFAVKPAEGKLESKDEEDEGDEDKTKRWGPGCKRRSDTAAEMCPKGECPFCDKKRSLTPPSSPEPIVPRSAPTLETNGDVWWIEQEGKRVLGEATFTEFRHAQDCMNLLRQGPQADLTSGFAGIFGELQRSSAELLQETKDYIALYTTGRI